MANEDHNEQFKITEFKNGADTKSVYLLNPGQVFSGFGGSRSGLLVRKTASLIVRESGPAGCYDTEYDIADKKVWDRIFYAHRNATK